MKLVPRKYHYRFATEKWNKNIKTGCPKKKRGISEWYSVNFTAHMKWNLEYPFLIHLKIEIRI